MIIVDFETRSRCDLVKHGTYNYVRDVSTEIICCVLKDLESGYTDIFRNPALYPAYRGKLLPAWLIEKLENPEILLAAHNAEFDAGVWDYVAEPDYNFPYVEWNRWYCTSAMCRVNALPAGLDKAAFASGSPKRKDFAGARLIKKLCIPREDGKFNEDDKDLSDMVTYCKQDVDVTEELLKRCRPMTVDEHKDWLVNREINERGVKVDIELANLACEYATSEAEEIATELSKETLGVITKHTQTQRIAKWVKGHLEEAGITTTSMVRYKDGKKRYSVDKSVRAELLDRATELDIPDYIVRVLELTNDGNRSSVAKFTKMLELSDANDHRVRGAYLYAGAGQTLRYSSRWLQVHNMRRDCFDATTTKDLISLMREAGKLNNVMDTLSKLLRPSLIPKEGHKFVIGDWSAIEAMVLPWLADSPGSRKLLERFRDGVDVYQATGVALEFDPDDPLTRQIGKVVILSLGFGGANGAFNAMARNYGVQLDEAVVNKIVRDWRAANSWAPDFWRDLEQRAKFAIGHPGVTTHAGRVGYLFQPELLGGTLLCFLPGDVCIQYPKARIESVETPWGRRTAITALKASWTPSADADEWPRATLWHGLLTENVTQAFAARLLRELLRDYDDDNHLSKVVLHTHDEVVLEVPDEHAYAARNLLRDRMNRVPDFAKGLPLKAKPIIASRYG